MERKRSCFEPSKNRAYSHQSIRKFAPDKVHIGPTGTARQRRDWLDRRAELPVKLLNRGERLVVEGKADGLTGFRREIRGEVGLDHPARALRRHHRPPDPAVAHHSMY